MEFGKLNNSGTKELAFVTITMRDPEDKDTSKADFEVQMTNINTAGIKVIKFDFKPDPRLGRKDFPINRDRAEGLVVSAMEELIQTLPAEMRENHDTHFVTSDVFDVLLQVANKKLKDFSLLPNPIETPFGKIEFIERPNKENFTSLADLPNLAFSAMRKSDGTIHVLYVRLKPVAEMPEMSHGYHMGYGRNSRDWGTKKTVVDRSQAVFKIADQLADALSPYDMEISPENPPTGRRFDGQNPQPEPDRNLILRNAYCEMADQLIQRMYENGEFNGVPDFTFSKGGRVLRQEDGEHSFIMSLHLGGDYVFHVLSGEYLQTVKRERPTYAPFSRGDVVGSIIFDGEKRGFSIAYGGHHRFAVPFDVKELMDPPKVLAAINKAIEKHLQPYNLGHFLDTSTIQFEPIEKK